MSRTIALACTTLLAAASAQAQDAPGESEMRHVPPDPPSHAMHDMSVHEMTELMQMDDTAPVGLLLIDQAEWRDNDTLAWNGHAWYGGDYNRVWLALEGEHEDGENSGRAELLWDRTWTRWWNLQAGVRHDFGEGPARTWLAMGLRGTAPHWVEIEAEAYVGDGGRTAVRFSAEQDLLITQRLVLQPKLELNLYGKDDPENGIGAGLSDSQLALRIRYEVRREFAPYVGIVWKKAYGKTSDLAGAQGHDTNEVQFAAGLRVWF